MFEVNPERNFDINQKLLYLIWQELKSSRELTEKIINESKLPEVKIEKPITKKKR